MSDLVLRPPVVAAGNPSAAALLAFAVLTAVAMLAPLAGAELEYGRARMTIWITLTLATPAIAMFVLRFRAGPLTPAWRSWWSIALAAFLLHLWYGFVVLFGGELHAVLTSQGTLVGSSNFVLAAVWTCSVAAAWLVPAPRWSWWLHALATLLFWVSAVVSTVLFGGPTSKLVGCLFVLALLIAAATRVLSPQFCRRQ